MSDPVSSMPLHEGILIDARLTKEASLGVTVQDSARPAGRSNSRCRCTRRSDAPESRQITSGISFFNLLYAQIARTHMITVMITKFLICPGYSQIQR